MPPFFKALNQLEFVSSSSDQALVQAIIFARANHRSRSLWISREATDPDTDKKRRQKTPEKIDRHQFEICLFSALVNEQKSADVCIVGSDDFSDPTDQLVSMEEFWKKLPNYVEVVGLPIDTAGFIAHIKKHLNTQAQKHEAAYPNNKEFSVEHNRDTHAQSLTVLGLAYLLGIQLMPRIARWKDLKIYKFPGESYPNIDPMFTVEEINEDLIAKHLPDMQRVAVSILEGRISPSFILRRLTSGTRKNKLYYAFQELGKVVRSAYLLKYLRKPELRRTVNHATTVSERFNDFIPFVTFGNRDTIASNSRDEQRKIIKYGHLVANILIFMNELIQEGHVITKEQVACLAPYRKANTNRFGAYFLDELRDAMNIDYRLPVVSLSN
jgi:hypothetical protein